ncbi:MAG: bacillithiol biosynthesis deacetylase BshB1 [Acidobacteriota bacterium]
MKLDVLAIGAHPDDVELGCGGTVASMARAGRSVGILHLTRGEAGTRGTPEERRLEAEEAAQALGAVELRFLDCGDGSLRSGPEEEDALIEVLRELRPDMVLSPTPYDRHPDHIRAHRLVQAVGFYAGLRARGSKAHPTHRPAAVFSYMQHDSFEPDFVVDVSHVWEAKIASLAAHRSQIHLPGAPASAEAGGPVTKVSTPEFYFAMEGRARHYGNLIGATYGEPFWSPLPLAVRDPFSILPGGVR